MANIITLINGIVSLALLYTLCSVPVQIVKRFRRKSKGLQVSPFKVIVKNFVKHWCKAALLLILLSATVTILAGKEAGLGNGDIIAYIMIESIVGNLGTSIFVGYVWMLFNRGNWSVNSQSLKRV